MSTAKELLDLALGDPSGWERLTDLCLDRANAETLARALESSELIGNDAVRDWASALEEMHPKLKISLPEKR